MKVDITSLGSADEILQKLPALPYEDKNQLPSRQGIYFLINTKNEILYIGKTKNFNTRWISHHKITEITEKFRLEEMLIAYCEVPDSEIDQSEAFLIKKHKPQLNVSLVPENIRSQAIKWFNEIEQKSTTIPRELRLWIHKKYHCTCQVCGSLVEDKRIGITKNIENDDSIDNLILVCRSCRSRMRSNKSVESYKMHQKSLLLRDIKKVKESVEFYFSDYPSEINILIEFIKDSDIVLPIERN